MKMTTLIGKQVVVFETVPVGDEKVQIGHRGEVLGVDENMIAVRVTSFSENIRNGGNWQNTEGEGTVKWFNTKSPTFSSILET